MARCLFVAQSGPIQLDANTPKTMLGLVAPSDTAGAIKRWILTIQGASPTAKPILVELGKPTGGTQADVTEFQLAGPAITNRCVAKTYSAEPTWTSLAYYSHYLHPQAGYEKVLQRAEDEWVFLNSIWALRCTSAAAEASVNVITAVEWEE